MHGINSNHIGEISFKKLTCYIGLGKVVVTWKPCLKINQDPVDIDRDTNNRVP